MRHDARASNSILKSSPCKNIAVTFLRCSSWRITSCGFLQRRWHSARSYYRRCLADALSKLLFHRVILRDSPDRFRREGRITRGSNVTISRKLGSDIRAGNRPLVPKLGWQSCRCTFRNRATPVWSRISWGGMFILKADIHIILEKELLDAMCLSSRASFIFFYRP